MAIFQNKEEYKKWIDENDWYQTINLPSGFRTPGKVPTDLREPLFDGIDFKGKTFIDVGCNSGHYCFTAKDRGAGESFGIDTNTKRIQQARILAENEGYDVRFEERSIFDLSGLPRFDIVFCIAVLTEIQDTFGAIEQLKKLIGNYALIEVGLAKPILYASYSRLWLKEYGELPRRTGIAEVKRMRGDQWVIRQSFDVLKAVFGKEFKLTPKEGGIRYDLIEVVRVGS